MPIFLSVGYMGACLRKSASKKIAGGTEEGTNEKGGNIS